MNRNVATNAAREKPMDTWYIKINTIPLPMHVQVSDQINNIVLIQFAKIIKTTSAMAAPISYAVYTYRNFPFCKIF